MRKIILLLAALSLACSPTPSSEWNEYVASVDDSVGCAIYDPAPQDVGIDKNNGILAIVANKLSVPGMFVDAIASRSFDWRDNSTYTLSGEWRKPPNAQNEQIDVNLQFVRDFTEHRAELLWTLNPHSPLYGWVWTRAQSDEPIKLRYLGDDTNWHKFRVVVEYLSGNVTVKELGIDSYTFPVNMRAGTLPKAWEGSFFVLLETHNMYTGCLPVFNFVGRSEWDSVSLTRGE